MMKTYEIYKGYTKKILKMIKIGDKLIPQFKSDGHQNESIICSKVILTEPEINQCTKMKINTGTVKLMTIDQINHCKVFYILYYTLFNDYRIIYGEIT